MRQDVQLRHAEGEAVENELSPLLSVMCSHHLFSQVRCGVQYARGQEDTQGVLEQDS